MEALYLLIPLSVALIFFVIGLFLHAFDDGQFDDMVSPAWRILLDNDKAPDSTDQNS